MRAVFLLLILHQASVIMAMQGYVLTGPKILLPESVEKFCVSIEGNHESVNCTLDLMAAEDDVVFSSVTQRLSGAKDCLDLSVPTITEPSARLRWRMQVDGLPDYKVDSTKEVVIRQTDIIHLIQTDKAWYTPGQLVRFRILSLNHLLHPILNTIERVWIEDPTGTSVAQWTNITTAHGIHQFELQLSGEPVQGSWRVRTKKGDKEFEVREYVLPKFEVNLNPPPFINFNEEGDNSVQKILVGICGKYSYGQPVKGTWRAEVTVTNSGRYYRWRGRPDVQPLSFERKGVLNEDNGCHSMKLSGEELGISTYDGTIDKTIKVTAFVTEQGTDLEMNATWSTVVKRQTLTLDIASWSSRTFKNGLPYYGKIKVSTSDGQPAIGTAVEVCAQPIYDPSRSSPKRSSLPIMRPSTGEGPKHCAVRVPNDQGIVNFTLLPNEEKVLQYVIKATVTKTKRKRRSIWSSLVAASPIPDVVSETQFVIHKTYSPSDSFLLFVPHSTYPKPADCLTKLPVKLYFTAEKEINFNLHYMVMARGDVVLTDVKQVKFVEEDNIDLVDSLGETLLNKRESESESELDTAQKLIGELEFDIEIAPTFAPKISLLAYYVRNDREVVTASFEVPVENCFPNPVQMSFSSKRKQPGENVTMILTSGPGSICGYSVVDRSVTYARPDLQLSESNVYSRLSGFHIEAGSRPSQITPEWEYCAKKAETEPKQAAAEDESVDLRRRKRSFYPWLYRSDYKDAMEAFDNAGVLVMSDLNIETRPCNSESAVSPRGGLFYRADTDLYDATVDLSSTVAVRTYFPETWLWDLVTLDSKGNLKKTVELPHTVTTWVGRALCVSEREGFGMSSAANIEAFQPFFLEIHLPYAAKRTEKLKTKVSVFNYAPHALPVRLTLARSEQFELLDKSPSASFCIPARNKIVHHFLVSPTELGTHNFTVEAIVDETFPGHCGPETLPSGRDSVIKELLVQPEGFPVERIYSHMACPRDFEEDKTLVWDLSLPQNLVEGSARAWVTAVGDLMGPALQGLSGLVRLPMGCGEQNMILFTPIIYVIQYLEATNQLEPAVKAKAISYMKSGYQRELTYRHPDGSYSAFGKSDPEGSLWLTAFVVKSFAAARRYIHVDDSELQSSIRWLRSKQLENGCFPVVGTVLHKDLKGGLSESEDLAPLTAFTLISLAEMYSDENATSEQLAKLVENTLPCLKEDEGALPDPYTKALTAYALVVAGKNESARTIIDWLMNHAQKNNSLIWWEKTGSGPALSVEMTSYVLLCLVKLGTSQDLLNARSIVRWLSKQRNSEGGFVSTQDTVVALQAMAAYASSIGAQPVDMEILFIAGDLEHAVHIREQDRLLQRRIDLPLPLAANVNVSSVGEGNGCAMVQATLRYNVHTSTRNAAFDLNVTSVEEGGPCGTQRLTICTRHNLAQASNMALLEIGLVTGYEVNKTSLEALAHNETSRVKRYETKGDVVVLYFDQISEEICISLLVRPAFQVNDAKEANVKIYDYYQPEHSRSVSYNLPGGCLPVDSELSAAESPVVVQDISQESSHTLAQPLILKNENVEQKSISRNNRRQTKKQDMGDLLVPDGIEGPTPVFARPDQSRGCPNCVMEVPRNFAALYCQSLTAYGAETRPAKGKRLRLIYDVSRQHDTLVRLANATIVDLSMEPQCNCSFFEQGPKVQEQHVTVIGLPKHDVLPPQLMVGPELWIIGKKHSDPKLKASRSKKCPQ